MNPCIYIDICIYIYKYKYNYIYIYIYLYGVDLHGVVQTTFK